MVDEKKVMFITDICVREKMSPKEVLAVMTAARRELGKSKWSVF